jgi:hypothetical protein
VVLPLPVQIDGLMEVAGVFGHILAHLGGERKGKREGERKRRVGREG